MTLLAATPNGLYRVARGADPTRELDTDVRQVRTSGDVAYAATDGGLLVSEDTGCTWRDTALSATDVHSVNADEGLIAGTRPLAAYRRRKDWHELTELRELAVREGWPTPSFREEAWARTLSRDAGRVLVGVEVGGLAVRDEDGTWRSVGPTESDEQATQRCDDVHGVTVRSRDEWVLATADGVHHTTDAGGTWTRLDTGTRRYCREMLSVDGRLYVSVNASPPRWRPPDGAVYVGPPADLQRVRYPGGPERFVVSWASDDDTVYAGANDGAVIRFDGQDATTVASVPVSDDGRTAYGVRSLAVV